MRKFLYAITAVAALLATSCVKEVAEDVQPVGGQSTITFSVDAPQLNSRSYGLGIHATDLYFAVYNAAGEVLPVSVLPGEEPIELVAGAASFDVPLATGLTYNIVFWAAAPEALTNGTYSFDWAAKTMTIDPAKLQAQDETLDAFYSYKTITVQGTENHSVKLYRPFAQVNVGTADTAAAAAAGLTVAETYIKVKGYTTLDLATGAVSNPQTMTYVADTKASGTLTSGGNNYDWLAMAYVLVNERESVDEVIFGYNTTAGAAAVKEHKVTMVPVQRNFRTNIVGNVLTSSSGFDVDIEEELGGTETVNLVTIGTTSYSTLEAAVAAATSGDTLEVQGNLDVTEAMAVNKDLTLDLNGNTLTAVVGEDANTRVGKNEFMFTVTKGSLNLKNGTIIYEYKGENMAWNNCTAIFNITDGGEVNLSGVTAKNLGGTDMNFVAHLNNWGEVTLNVDNSTLEATYIAVRVFNSGNDMNNVTIKNTTLKGKYCFWVHNYTLADFGNDQSKVDAHKALLNFDIINGTNTFVPAEGRAPILYGFTNAVYYDANGYEWINAGASKDAEGNYHISSAEGLTWVAEQVNTAAAQAANLFDNVTVYLENDIDLGGEAWTPIGDYAFSRTVFRGVFDGQDHTISNFNVGATTRTDKVAECPYGLFGNVSGTIKNLKVDHAVVAPEGGRFAGVLAGRLKEGAVIDNCHISNSEATISHWQVGGIAGQVNDADIKNSSVSYSTITGYAGVGAIAGFLMVAGEYDIENCEVKECSLVQNGSFGGNYDTMYGLAVGTINNGSVVCNINDIKIEGNTIMGNASETLVGYIEEGAKLYVDGGIASVAAFKAAVAAEEEHIKLAIEVDLADIILSGHNGTIEGVGENAALNTRNFTPSADEAYQLRSTNLTFKNLDIKLPTDIDWIRSGFVGTGTIVFDDCDFEGQATLNGSATWIFNDCDFVSTVEGCYASFVYGATKATFNRCTFGGVDRAAKVYGTGGVLDVEYNTCQYTSTTLNKNGVEIDASYATTTVNLNSCEQTAMAGLYALKGTNGTVYVDGVQQ